MKVVLYLTAVEKGGAADCTFNCHRQSINLGWHSYVAVSGKKIYTFDGKIIPIYQRTRSSLWNRIKIKEKETFVDSRHPYLFNKYAPLNLNERISIFNAKDLLEALPEVPSVIYVHWVSGFANMQYVNVLQKLTKAKIFFVMIDEAILTGGCHYPWKCEGISNGCKNCPMTTSRSLKLHVRWNFIFKQFYLPKEKNIILYSKFDENKVRRSKLWKNANIYKTHIKINENVFKPADDKIIVRSQLGLPINKKIIFFGCSYLTEERKGMTNLISALNKLHRNDIFCAIAGKGELSDIAIPYKHFGTLSIENLAKLYQAVDLYVCSSLEDSGPQMINMALMSGCPTVSFETGVALDFVVTGKTGYLAKWADNSDLAKGIDYILDIPKDEYNKLSECCREIALDNFSENSKNQIIF